MFRFAACCVVLSFASRLVAAEPEKLPSADEDRAVQIGVDRTIAWLESDMQAWREEHGCAACHHGPMYVWAVSVARQQGYDINETQFAAFSRWLLTDDEARIFPKSTEAVAKSSATAKNADRMAAAMRGHRNLSQPTIYLTHALNALRPDDPLREVGWRKVIDHLVSVRHDDGSFVGRDAWRPIFNTPQILTRFVVAGIHDRMATLPDDHRADRQNAGGADGDATRDVLQRAEAYLAGQAPDETHQGLILRLLGERDLSRDSRAAHRPSVVVELVDQLRKLQRPDGGWAQTEERDSDAFATGQTLFALYRAGITPTDPALRRGIGFLLRTQQPDGTWLMTSRPNPENGKPAGNLNPITYAAAAWATLGLTSNVPRVAH